MSTSLRTFHTLVRREAWEYRAWWTLVLWSCVALASVGLWAMAWQYPAHEASALAFQDTFFLRWNHGLYLGAAGVMALAHAAHAVFDERQDRSIGFWQSFPVPERTRLLAKSVAIACGWPFLAMVADTSLAIVALGKSLALGSLAEGWHQVFPAWTQMMRDCLSCAAWGWPLVCGWLFCSALAPRTPWAWGWGVAAVAAGVAFIVGADPLSWGAALALGPGWGALAEAAGKPALLPWQVGSLAWVASCALGWWALCQAGRRVGDRAEL